MTVKGRRPKRPCIFCERSCRPTKEDAIPNWLRRDFPHSGPFRFYVPDHGEPGPRHPLLRAVTTTVCRACNNGWMSRLENSVKPLIRPAMYDRPVVLGSEDQTLVATWALKTAGLVELAVSDRRGGMAAHLPYLAWLAAHREPPPGTNVWLFRYLVEATRPVRLDSFTGSRGFVTTLVFGCLGLQVSGGSQEFGKAEGFARWGRGHPMDAAVLRIHPPSPEPQTWPPANTLTPADLDVAASPPPEEAPPT